MPQAQRICRIQYSYTNKHGQPMDENAILINQPADLSPDKAKRELLKTRASLRNARDLVVIVIPGGITQEELLAIHSRIPAGQSPIAIDE